MIGNRTASDWLEEYGASHQNSTNKLIHWIAVPVIFLTVIGMLWDIPVPSLISSSLPWFHWGLFGLAFSVVFYIMFSTRLAVGLVIFCAICWWLLHSYYRVGLGEILPLWQASLIVFVIAWVFQFIGHILEGVKPSFFKDVLFLMVGPAFVMGYVYRALGISYD